VQESGFFRHPDQFAALARVVLPAIDGPVVVWSAGCANGQEPYSLAMELAASGHPDWQVLATDISAAAVARTRAGRYSTAELAGLPPAHRHWLRPVGDAWEIDLALRRRVRVEHANLTARFPIEPGRCQVVFCRNVLIYLARTVTESFLDRLAGWLPPDGLAFLGYSEAMLAPTGRLRVEQVGNAFALRVVPEGRSEGLWTTPRTPTPASGGLWTTRSSPPAGRLRSPTGGPDAGAAGSGAPAGAAEMAVAGEVAAGGGDLAGAVAAFRKAVFLDRTSRSRGSSSGWPSGRSRTSAGPAGPMRPPWPRWSGATRAWSGTAWTGGRPASWPACSGPSWGGHDDGGVVPFRRP
jgi:chemotaxis methyl-accepting protein methylase